MNRAVKSTQTPVVWTRSPTNPPETVITMFWLDVWVSNPPVKSTNGPLILRSGIPVGLFAYRDGEWDGGWEETEKTVEDIDEDRWNAALGRKTR